MCLFISVYNGEAAWSDWGPFSTCSLPCYNVSVNETGEQTRTRTCVTRIPKATQADPECTGNDTETRSCRAQSPCPRKYVVYVTTMQSKTKKVPRDISSKTSVQLLVKCSKQYELEQKGRIQLSGVISVPCWNATTFANDPLKPLLIR